MAGLFFFFAINPSYGLGQIKDPETADPPVFAKNFETGVFYVLR